MQAFKYEFHLFYHSWCTLKDLIDAMDVVLMSTWPCLRTTSMCLPLDAISLITHPEVMFQSCTMLGGLSPLTLPRYIYSDRSPMRDGPGRKL